jgi:hypothetical protein
VSITDELARLSAAARPGRWGAYETVQADNFIVREGEGLFNGPGPIMGPSYDKTTVEYVVALVNAHRSGLLHALPESPAADAREALIESATWALIEYDTDTADRGVRDEHYRERRADVERVAPILANLRRLSTPTEEDVERAARAVALLHGAKTVWEEDRRIARAALSAVHPEVTQ